jgi:signal transduction histidine kinase
MSVNYSERIYTEQVGLLYTFMPMGLVATVINAVVVAILHIGLVPAGILWSWLLALVVVSALRGGVGYTAYRRDVIKGRRVRMWGGVFVAGIALSGVLWGCAAGFHLLHYSEAHRILVAFVLGGMSAGAAVTFSGLRGAYFGYTVPALLPQIVLFFAGGRELDTAMAGLLAFFWVLVSVTAEANRRMTGTSFRLRYEKEDLIASLVRAKGEMEGMNAALRVEIGRRERTEEQLRAAQAELEQKVEERTAELAAANSSLEQANRELSEFTHTVSHDLRAPLRTIGAFSEALEEDYGPSLDEGAGRYIAGIRAAVRRMKELIEDLLLLSRVTRAELERANVNLTAMVRDIVDSLRVRDPDRRVEVVVADTIEATCDPRLVRVALENLLDNAWKYTANRERARIEIGVKTHEGGTVYFVTDNGVGFDMAFADKIFAPFKRLHSYAEYPGTGVGLATVQRIICRHGGTVWAESVPGRGTTMYFTLSEHDSARLARAATPVTGERGLQRV